MESGLPLCMTTADEVLLVLFNLVRDEWIPANFSLFVFNLSPFPSTSRVSPSPYQMIK